MSDENNPAALAPYDPEWPRLAEDALTRVRKQLQGLSGATTATFDHIGSTAVPGLSAKPFIDFQVRIST